MLIGLCKFARSTLRRSSCSGREACWCEGRKGGFRIGGESGDREGERIGYCSWIDLLMIMMFQVRGIWSETRWC